MRREFLFISLMIIGAVGALAIAWPPILFSYILIVPIFVLGIMDMLQTKKAVIRNFPIIGRLRYIFEMIRPEIQQYFVENETDGRPISREFRSLVYQRAKLQLDTVPFGTLRDVYDVGYEWVDHSLAPKHLDTDCLRVQVGGSDCSKPYSTSVFNISGMSYGALSENAILSLNGGAQIGNFYHNTGEGGVSPFHKKPGGDLVWQIGTGYFGCRTKDGLFDPNMFKETAALDQIKMIEIKLSQGAKPAHGGILPAAKITPEIAAIRGVPMDEDVISPPFHRAFNTPIGLLQFAEQLRTLSGGKPVGFKLCVGHPHEFMAICKAMLETKIYPDYIAVDGGEGGTGAAPLEFTNAVGAPLDEGLVFVKNCLDGFDLKKHIKIISSGKIFTGFQILNKIALGADLTASARGMMLALGCIQARRCNSNHCPVGVATNNPQLVVGLDVTRKTNRVANYHSRTIQALSELAGAVGIEDLDQLKRSHVRRRISKRRIMTYEDLFPTVRIGDFLDQQLFDPYSIYYRESSSKTFAAQSS